MVRDQKRVWRRCIALLLCICMILGSNSGIVYADNNTGDGGLCKHHPAHTEECGYTEGTEGVSCSHVHDGTCGYSEGTEEVPCDHTHDANCGYSEGTVEDPCTHQHDDSCGYIEGVEGSCTHAHDADCGYQAAVSSADCNHNHNGDCSYQAAADETPCTHVHDADCGYQAATAGSACTFFCPICNPEYYPAMAESGVSIVLPVQEDTANTLMAGEQINLLEGIDFEISEEKIQEEKQKGNELTVDDFVISVFSVLDSETEESAELTDEQYLTPEEGHSYLIIYAVYEKESGSLVAATERTVNAVEPTSMNDGEVTIPADKSGVLEYITYDTNDGTEAGANTKFTVKLPENTSFMSSDGNDTVINPQDDTLTLKITRYTEQTEDFDFESHKKLIDEHMNWHTGGTDSTNDVQFWRAWFEDANGKEVVVRFPEGAQATVVVEWLNVDGALKGNLGTRRTCVMDMGAPNVSVPGDTFISTDDYSLMVSSEPQALGKTATHYTKMTYFIDVDQNGESAWGNLIALCSMKLESAYIKSASFNSIVDGSAPFDDPEDSGGDNPGNDSSQNNRVVRTFDNIVYTLDFSGAARSTETKMYSYIAVAEAELHLDIMQARFDAEQLSYVFTGDDDWRIEYKNAEGDNVYIENKSGIYKCDFNGAITNQKVTLNQIAGSSNNENNGAYRTEVKSQRLVAYMKVSNADGSELASANQQMTIQVNVTAAENGDRIEPDFRIYVKGNRDNFTSEQDENNNYVVSEPSTANKITTQNTENSITVSAAARYNIVLKRNQDASYSSYFNFASGQETTENDENGVYGRMLSYGITLQLFNETNKKVEYKDDKGNVVKDSEGNPIYVSDGAVIKEKGLRGVELPVNGITFDLTLEGTAGANNTSTDDYSAILWDYAQSVEGNKTGLWGRNMYWKESNATTFPKGASIYSSGGRTNSAYVNGDWTLNAVGDGINDGKTTGGITNTGSGVKYTFTVEDFDFDFDDFSFAKQSAGNAGEVPWLSPDYIGSFSGGHIQVLQKYPDNVTMSATPQITAEVSNFSAISKSGAHISEEAGPVTDQIGGIYDNKVTVSVPVYAPGGMSQHNSFGERVSGHGSIGEGFLGTKYWEGPNYDAYTFAGTSIYLWGGAQLGRSSDAVVSAYNLLQKFDSKVISIDTSVENPVRYTDVNNDAAWPAEGWPNNKEGELLDAAGEYKVLYAADPMYPDGWDSNNEEEMQRMRDAKEDDLIYFSSVADLEAAGYICIAILLEVRDAEIPAGCYPGIRVAVKVSDNRANINETICTVNTARMWLKNAKIPEDKMKDVNLLKGISWADGDQNNLTRAEAEALTEFKNTIKDSLGNDIYTKFWDEEDRSNVNLELRNTYDQGNIYGVSYIIPNYNNFNYHKTEYMNGTQVKDTHEGYQQGMSLLIIGYETAVNLKVTNTATDQSSTDPDLTGNVSFSTPQGQWNPLYTIHGIKTKASAQGTEVNEQVTNLTIKASVLNDPKKEGKSQIAMGAADFKIQSLVDKSGEKVLDWISISEDENSPTEVTFKADNGREYTYKIWAKRTGEYDVEFYLLNVPVDKSLPDIQFEGQLGPDVEHSGEYTAQVTIQGDSDNRALSSGNNNVAAVTITTTILGGTSLIKRVNTTLIEQDGEITYSVSYTNNSDSEMDQKLFLYDIMPYNGDIRSSEYERDPDITRTSDALQVQSITGTVTGGNAGTTDNTVARIYYSTVPGSVLREFVDFSKGDDTTGEDIANLIRNALIGNDSNGIWYVVQAGDADHTPVPIYTYSDENPDIVTGINEAAVDYAYSNAEGVVKVKSGYTFYNPRLDTTAKNGELVPNNTGSGEAQISLECYKIFRWLDVIEPADNNNSIEAGSSNLTHATCVYAVVEKLGANKTLTMQATVKTNGNKATNVYGNIAHSWKAGDARDGLNLVSNLVSTRVVGREFSGLVWEDVNHDGIRNISAGGNEPLISGVTCTLFKWNATEETYEVVKGNEGPNGRQIAVTYMNAEGTEVTTDVAEGANVELVTGADGAYRFSNLASGDYVVAFSADDALDPYEKDAATHYQINGANDSDTNDGVVNKGYVGIDPEIYLYCIKYSKESERVHMHTLEDMSTNTSMLTNGVEIVDHQDLGVIIDRYELPETGGMGTMPYRTAGILLIMVCLPTSVFVLRRRRDLSGKNFG